MTVLLDSREQLLPAPTTHDGLSVAAALSRRRSQREFSKRTVLMEQVAQLCWAGQGITDQEAALRTAPSAGAIFPVDMFVVDATGVYQYAAQQHALRRILGGDVRSRLQAAALDQSCVGEAPLCLVVTVDVAKTASKYGDRAERYCLLEAGHVAQNVLLQATAMGLAGVPVGAFDDWKVAELVHLPKRLHPVYLLPVGYPAAAD
ncbi:MAG: SagB/ThcOx family dehydrogenase [Planctomycetia bacterium]|nr:SagB/ThcOx family dehydrogenase [Planctomycetia bacterium]